ncbi:vWA domain-containing protein [Brevibacterium casei]|uniref:VWA domain-containing protein n=2 Tax=Brevibacterium casei TaxID=33889 RepID=A0A7T2TGN2_9MICO|nr:VWA domain-containing protein [Brevibacterium casei]MCT1447924.1 VWA domain-containing protein [Brevibacterium casei]MCT1550006.1 VWA domain-containing protein [Brevibacterium casei]MCT1561295.1 VWA domain-containing protein [Brevibacterium casei]MCT2208044.1 VWA domain-containing protein [Brevibacterium casei]QPS33603.1 VWA domain-containing protein [Brevibacterium casei]
MTFDPLLGWIGTAVIVAVLLAVCLIPLIRGRGPKWKWFARIGVVAVLALALARPGVTTESTTEEYETAADVYFLVDTTTSMAAEDYNGTTPRIDGVKEDMLALAEQLPGARLSIITFASTASTAMPLTTDHAAFASAVDVLTPEYSLNSNGSSITEAGDELKARMDSNEEDRPGNKTLVFYFGDGEQTAPGQPDSWTSFASRIDSGAVFGYGTTAGGKMKESQPFGSGGFPGGTDQDPWDQDSSGQDGGGLDSGSSSDDEYIRDAEGNLGISTIDEANLRQLSSDLGVPYHLRDGSAPMSSVYTAPTYDQQLVRKDGRVTVDEYYWIPLALVFAWIAVEMIFAFREFVRLRAIMPPRRGGRRAAAPPPMSGPPLPGPPLPGGPPRPFGPPPGSGPPPRTGPPHGDPRRPMPVGAPSRPESGGRR